MRKISNICFLALASSFALCGCNFNSNKGTGSSSPSSSSNLTVNVTDTKVDYNEYLGYSIYIYGTAKNNRNKEFKII